MHIATVHAKAFKSVGADWLELSLSDGLNAIVGPNGSGKSSLLDAICFAFAAPPRSFGVATLPELQNSDCSEVCEVHVELRGVRRAAAAPGGRRGAAPPAASHWVAAALAPDGSRTFRVDGRLRSGKEVREFLRGLGVSLDSEVAVIKQAQVTRLADANSAEALAQVVAQTSGLGRWSEEIAAAAEELRRTRKAVDEVEGDLLSLERAAAADEEQSRALERLEREASELAQQIGLKLTAALAFLEAEGSAGRLGAAHEARVQAAERHDQAARDAAAVEAELERLRGADTAGEGGALSDLQQQLAALEEEVMLAQGRLEAHRVLVQRLEQQAAARQQATAAQAHAAAELTATREALGRAEAGLRLAEDAGSAHRLRETLTGDVERLRSSLASREQQVEAAAAGVQRCAARLASVEEGQRRLKAAEKARPEGDTFSAAAQERAAHLQMALAQARAAQHAAQQRERRASGEAGVLRSRLGGATGVPNTRPLHACFSFRDPSACQPWAEALAVLAGGKLGAVVADTTEGAGLVLAKSAGHGLRVWPLDSLAVPDQRAVQRRAAAAFAPGEVVVPADLLEFHPSATAAVLRAFGSHMLAASDTVASAVLQQHSLPCIMRDSTVAAVGRLTGGWRGGQAQVQTGPVAAKLRLDALVQQVAQAQADIHEAERAAAAAEAELAQLAAAREAAEQAAGELAAAEEEAARARLALEAARGAQGEAQAGADRLRADLAAKRRLLEGLAPQGGSTSADCTAQSSAALAGEVERLRQAAAALERQGAEHGAAAQRLGEDLAVTEGQLSVQQPEAWAEQLEEKRAELAEARAVVARRHAAAAVQSAEAEAKTGELERARRRLEEARAAVAAADAAAAAASEAAERQATTKTRLQGQLGELLKDVPELETALAAGGAAAAAAAAEPSLAAADKACVALGRRRAALLTERAASSAARVPLAEQLRLRERRAALEAMRQQARTLRLAASRLEEGIQSTSPQVLAANEAVFRRIAATFRSLIAGVLPAYDVRLAKTGEAVHEGVQFQFRGRGADAAGGGGSGDAGGDEAGARSGAWRAGLDALSGGQRTMVSLALVVAAAMAGGCSEVLLLDEVDAALDESNQALLAKLLSSISGGGSGKEDGAGANGGRRGPGCSQCVCISHNAAFQALCGRVLKVSRGPAGTLLAAAGGRGGSAAAAAGPKRARK
eukprot:scaffold7.g3385.t1